MLLFINNISDKNKTFLTLTGSTCEDTIKLDLIKKDKKSENILYGIDNLLHKTNKNIHDLKGIIVVNGPGSFVGIRIALSIANTMAWMNNIPVVGIQLFKGATNNDLITKGLKNLLRARKGELVKPFYGKEPHITKQKVNSFPHP